MLTNNPRKIAGLGGYGLQVVERVPLVMNAGDHNADYLAAKRDKLGHLFDGNDPCTVLAVAVADDAEMLPLIRSQVEDLALSHGQQLEALHEPRLLALWDRPQFVWKLIPAEADPTALIKAVAALPATRRMGLMRVGSQRMAQHPPQTLEREEHQLSELRNGGDGPFITSPALLHWSSPE